MVDQIRQPAIPRQGVEEGSDRKPIALAGHLADDAVRALRDAQGHGHADETLLPHGRRLDGVVVLEHRQQREQRGGREVDVGNLGVELVDHLPEGDGNRLKRGSERLVLVLRQSVEQSVPAVAQTDRGGHGRLSGERARRGDARRFGAAPRRA
jgi:hypothetical protein